MCDVMADFGAGSARELVCVFSVTRATQGTPTFMSFQDSSCQWVLGCPGLEKVGWQARPDRGPSAPFSEPSAPHSECSKGPFTASPKRDAGCPG